MPGAGTAAFEQAFMNRAQQIVSCRFSAKPDHGVPDEIAEFGVHQVENADVDAR
jgi:hypothetical protein